MTCAAQLIRHEGGDCELQFSNARWIASKLTALAEREDRPARIYITDIPANVGCVPAARQLAQSGVEIYWFDHHPWEEDLVADLRQACAEIVHRPAIQYPAGILLGMWLDAQDPYCGQIGRICYASERGTPWERDWFRLLSSYVGKGDRAVLERLANDVEFTSDDRERIAAQVELELEAERVVREGLERLQSANGRSIAVYDTSALPGIYVGRKVFSHHDVDYSLVRIALHKWQLACHPDRGLDMARLIGRHPLEGASIRVAGRPDRLLSIELGDQDEPGDVHVQVLAWAAKRV
jgi:hypothetical protein